MRDSFIHSFIHIKKITLALYKKGIARKKFEWKQSDHSDERRSDRGHRGVGSVAYEAYSEGRADRIGCRV